MRFGCVALILAMFPLAASAQMEEPMFSETQFTLSDEGDVSTVISFSARVTGLRGTMFTDGPNWGDIFKPGIGVGAELSRLWENDGWYGFFAGVNFNDFEGDKFTNSVGDSIETDRLMMGSLVAGVRGRGDFQGLFNWDMRIGGGLAVYDGVEVTQTIGGVATSGLEFLKPSGNFMTESSLRLGFGPLSVGAGVGYVAPPTRGIDFGTIHPRWYITYFGEVALTVDF